MDLSIGKPVDNFFSSKINNSNQIRPYQKEAVDFIIQKNGNAILSLEQGLGKTLCSIIYTTKNNYKTLVITPNSLKYNFALEIKKWSNKNYHIVESGDKTINFSKDYTIISNSIIHKFYNIEKRGKKEYFILKPQFENALKRIDCLILDESSDYKNYSTRRTKAVRKLPIPRKLLLTGTPIYNTPIDLWSQLNIVDSNYWGNFITFRNMYVSGFVHPRYGFFIPQGSKNEKLLSENLKPFMFRRRKEDVENLPPKIYSLIPLELSPKARMKYTEAQDNFKKFLEQFTNLTKEEIYRRVRNEILTKILELKKICIEDKLESGSIEEIINNILNNGEKVVVFCYYKHTVQYLHSKFKNSVLVYGEVKPKERQKRVDRFQNNPKIKIFFATISTAGMGLTLTAANNVIFCSMPWTNSELMQAEDRTHRLNQPKPVNIYKLITWNSIEQSIYRLLEKKQNTIDSIIEGKKIKRNVNIKNQLIKSQIKNLLT